MPSDFPWSSMGCPSRPRMVRRSRPPDRRSSGGVVAKVYAALPRQRRAKLEITFQCAGAVTRTSNGLEVGVGRSRRTCAWRRRFPELRVQVVPAAHRSNRCRPRRYWSSGSRRRRRRRCAGPTMQLIPAASPGVLVVEAGAAHGVGVEMSTVSAPGSTSNTTVVVDRMGVRRERRYRRSSRVICSCPRLSAAR